jgi:ubiE/COQ5 methyltransferase-like protein
VTDLSRSFGCDEVSETERERRIRRVFELVAARYDFKAMMERTGFTGVVYRNLTFGVARIHVGVKPR